METNFAPKFVQKGDDIRPITKRAVCIVFPNKRRFTRSPGDVGEENGVPPMLESSALRETVLTPSIWRAFFRYWNTFTKECPVDECGNLIVDFRRIDACFGPPFRQTQRHYVVIC